MSLMTTESTQLPSICKVMHRSKDIGNHVVRPVPPFSKIRHFTFARGSKGAGYWAKHDGDGHSETRTAIFTALWNEYWQSRKRDAFQENAEPASLIYVANIFKQSSIAGTVTTSIREINVAFLTIRLTKIIVLTHVAFYGRHGKLEIDPSKWALTVLIRNF